MAHDVVINITYRAPRKEGESGKTLVNASGNPSPWMVCKMLLDAHRMAATKVDPWIEERIQEVRDQYESPIISPHTGQAVKREDTNGAEG